MISMFIRSRNKKRYNVDNIKKLFLKDLSDFIKQWPIEARKTLKDNARLLTKFDRRYANHKWMVVKIPVWDISDGIRNMSKKDFGELRKRANKALKTARTSFWKDHKAVILSIDLQHPEFLPKSVHPTLPFLS